MIAGEFFFYCPKAFHQPSISFFAKSTPPLYAVSSV
jgi:hypothetical protein